MASLTCPHCGIEVDVVQIYCPNCTRSLRLTAPDQPQEVTKAHPTRTVGWVVALGVIGVCALAAVPLLIVPALAIRRVSTAPLSAGSPAQRTMCMSNLRQVATSALIYQVDWDDRNFPSIAYQPALMPYSKNATVFYCPLTRAQYSANREMLKVETKKVAKPADTVLLFEGSGKTVSAPHMGLGHVAFTEGSVRAMPPSAITKLRWKP